MVAAIIFSKIAGAELNELLPVDRLEAFRKVILFFVVFIFGVAILVLFILRPIDKIQYERKDKIDISKIAGIMRNKAVWLQAIIILCAYCGYKVSDDFSLIAQDYLNYSESDSAFFTTLTFWIRPISAVSFGFIGDRIKPSRLIQYCFLAMLIAGLNMGFGIFDNALFFHVFFNIVLTAIAVYAIRGLYLAIMKETRVPIAVTGTAFGLVSTIGYLPDIFMGPLMGYFLDNFTGTLRHEYLFLVFAGISFIGLMSSILFRRLVKRKEMNLRLIA